MTLTGDEEPYGAYEASTATGFELSLASIPQGNGVPIAVMRTAKTSARCAVFVHGLNGSWGTWSPMLRAIKDEGIDLGDLMILDFTDVALPTSLSSLEAFARSIFDYCARDHYTSISLVGHSTGSSLAAFMASRQDMGTVDKFYSICGLFIKLFEEARVPLLRSSMSDPTSSSLAKLKLLAKLGRFGEAVIKLLARSHRLSVKLMGGLYAYPDRLSEGIMHIMVSNYHAAALKETLQIGKVYNPQMIYSNITTTTRLVLGDADPLFPIDDAQQVSGIMRELTWVEIPGTGHFPHVERPRATTLALFGK